MVAKLSDMTEAKSSEVLKGKASLLWPKPSAVSPVPEGCVRILGTGPKTSPGPQRQKLLCPAAFLNSVPYTEFLGWTSLLFLANSIDSLRCKVVCCVEWWTKIRLTWVKSLLSHDTWYSLLACPISHGCWENEMGHLSCCLPFVLMSSPFCLLVRQPPGSG